MTSHSRDARVIDTVACPVCRAPRGEHCRDKAGDAIPSPHTDRRKLWQMARDGEIAGVPAAPRPTPTPRPWVAERRPDGTWILRTRYEPQRGARTVAEGLTEGDAALIVEAVNAQTD